MTYWITMWPAKGIIRVDDATVVFAGSRQYVQSPSHRGLFALVGKDVFIDEATAKEDMIRRLKKKIDSVDEQVRRLRKQLSLLLGEKE